MGTEVNGEYGADQIQILEDVLKQLLEIHNNVYRR